MGLGIINDSSSKFGALPKQYVIALGDEGKSPVDNAEEELTYSIKVSKCAIKILFIILKLNYLIIIKDYFTCGLHKADCCYKYHS